MQTNWSNTYCRFHSPNIIVSPVVVKFNLHIGPLSLIIVTMILMITYSYIATFICVSRHNAQKHFIVIIVDWPRDYIYKLSKCFVEQVSFKSGLEKSIDRACFTLRGRGFQRIGAALEKARFPNVSSRHLGELRCISSWWTVVFSSMSQRGDLIVAG